MPFVVTGTNQAEPFSIEQFNAKDAVEKAVDLVAQGMGKCCCHRSDWAILSSRRIPALE